MWKSKVDKLLIQSGSRFQDFCTNGINFFRKIFLENQIYNTKIINLNFSFDETSMGQAFLLTNAMEPLNSLYFNKTIC